MLSRAEIESALAGLEALEPLNRRDAETFVRRALAEGLAIAPESVRVSWKAGRMSVDIPTRLHYVDHVDLIMERLDAVARRIEFDFAAETPAEFTDLMKRLRGGE